MDDTVSIIIPTYGRYDLTHARLMELHRFAPECEVIVINDASPDTDVIGGVGWWQTVTPKVRYHMNKQNYGFGKSCNIGARMATGDILAFLSNDVIIRRPFVELMVEEINQHPENLFGSRLLYWDTGWNVFDFGRGKQIIPYLEGFFLACKREVWAKIGGFDPQYFLDYEDIDLSQMAFHRGIALTELKFKSFEHISGATISQAVSDRQKITLESREKFFEKWKRILNE
jgi:GT2 family glycosyltransferase